MKIVFLSNYFNHHQSCISKKLRFFTDDDFSFVETGVMREERRKLGYGTTEKLDYVIELSTDSVNILSNKIDNADIVIFGSAPEALLKSRKKRRDKTPSAFSDPNDWNQMISRTCFSGSSGSLGAGDFWYQNAVAEISS